MSELKSPKRCACAFEHYSVSHKSVPKVLCFVFKEGLNCDCLFSSLWHKHQENDLRYGHLLGKL